MTKHGDQMGTPRNEGNPRGCSGFGWSERTDLNRGPLVPQYRVRCVFLRVVLVSTKLIFIGF
jgi:hypothetical protein